MTPRPSRAAASVRLLPTVLPLSSSLWLPSQRARSVHVVSHHFDGFLRTEVPGLLHPGTGRGSPRFPVASTACCAAPVRRPLLAYIRRFARFPAAHLTPLEEVLPSAAVSHLCARCPLAVEPSLPADKSARYRRPSTSRLCSAVGSVAPFDRCQSTDALSFRGLCAPPGYWPASIPSTRRVSASARWIRCRRPSAMLPSPWVAVLVAAGGARLSSSHCPHRVVHPVGGFLLPGVASGSTNHRGRPFAADSALGSHRSGSVTGRGCGPSWGC